jgi:hypothetical protein
VVPSDVKRHARLAGGRPPKSLSIQPRRDRADKEKDARSSEIEQVIEFFRTPHEAERMLAEVIRDEPDWLEHFRIERIELGSESLN